MTHQLLESGGQLIEVESALPWVSRLVEETVQGEFRLASPGAMPSVVVRIESGRDPFDLRGFHVLTRGAWHREGEAILHDVCTSGFDLHVHPRPGRVTFRFRWRPPVRSRAAAWALPTRFRLLLRAVLLQYPALWWAGLSGLAPLHVSACTAGAARPLLAGPSGVGKSTLVSHELRAGGRATCDNLGVADGTTVWGVVEPLRLEQAIGRPTTHGRHEVRMRGRLPCLVPDRVVVVRRGLQELPFVRSCDSTTATRSLVTGTYMAGELRRYWSFAATLAAATGAGPAHPPVAEIAADFASRLPCFELVLGRQPRASLSELLQRLESIA